MSVSVKQSPSPPVLPKPEGRRIKSNLRVMSTAEDERELPELREKQLAGQQSKLQLVSLHNDLIPDELLASLTSTVCPLERLGPSKITGGSKECKVHGMRRTDAVWHHPTGRKKYKYFLDQPTTLTGAGRDISFLCDAKVSQKNRIPLPPMAERVTQSQSIHKDMSLMESMIPEEYHIVKNKGVVGLGCYDDKFTVLLEDEEKRLKIFPSMKPSGRLEAVQLMKVMDEMLDKAGVNQEFTELTELSQMQSLLELVRVEQNIYNIVFHELIRQVSVECAERGQLLAKLRQRYVSLLDRIPRQLKGLYTETLAQRALDRHLTQEIICFRDSISQLNDELSAMKDHDEHLSKQAMKAQEELSKALEQSRKNSDIVGEYHGLYEMQRRRLEGQVAKLTDERDLWNKVTYSLALKVIKENNLQLAGRLQVTAQTWAKTADHFTILLTSKDEEEVNRILQLTDQWKEQVVGLQEKLKEAERNQREKIKVVEAGIARWHEFCLANVSLPDVVFEKETEDKLFIELNQWTTLLTGLCERYGGEEVLTFQETLDVLSQLQENWVEVGLQLFRRHPGPDGKPPCGQQAMRELIRIISEFHKQLGTRVAGESGIHKLLMSLVGMMESWAGKQKTVGIRSGGLPHCDWLKFEKDVGSWIKMAEEGQQLVDSTQPANERFKQKPHSRIEIEDVFNVLREFVSTQAIFFDCENRRLSEEVCTIDTCLTRWMVDLLLLMVPDCCEDQESCPQQGPDIASRLNALKKLEEDAKNLTQKLDSFSKYLSSSCQALVEEDIQKNMTQDESENELYQLNKLQRECREWTDACCILLSSVKRCPVDKLVSTNAAAQSISDIRPSEEPSEESLVDQATGPSADTEQEEGAVEEGEPETQETAGADINEVSILKLIGHDGNITEKILREETALLIGTDEVVKRPLTPGAQRAFDAFATVGVLQRELLDAESRAQGAEERALKAEEALQDALEKILELERELQVNLVEKDDRTSVKMTSNRIMSPEPKTVDPKPGPSAKQRKPTKKS